MIEFTLLLFVITGIQTPLVYDDAQGDVIRIQLVTLMNLMMITIGNDDTETKSGENNLPRIFYYQLTILLRILLGCKP